MLRLDLFPILFPFSSRHLQDPELLFSIDDALLGRLLLERLELFLKVSRSCLCQIDRTPPRKPKCPSS